MKTVKITHFQYLEILRKLSSIPEINIQKQYTIPIAEYIHEERANPFQEDKLSSPIMCQTVTFFYHNDMTG